MGWYRQVMLEKRIIKYIQLMVEVFRCGLWLIASLIPGIMSLLIKVKATQVVSTSGVRFLHLKVLQIDPSAGDAKQFLVPCLQQNAQE